MDKAVSFWNIANMITLARVALLFVAVYLLFQGTTSKVIAFFIIIAIICLDFFDGFFARKLKIASKLGGVLDIVGDRIVENILWVVFAFLGLIQIWIPMVVLTRGFITDSIRSVALAKGMTAFGKETMMEGKIGRLIVSSNFSRFAYAAFKVASFAMLSLMAILKDVPDYSEMLPSLARITSCIVLATVAFCVIRAIPVIYDGRRLIAES